MTHEEFIEWLQPSCCSGGIDYAKKRKSWNRAKAWEKLERIDYLMWLHHMTEDGQDFDIDMSQTIFRPWLIKNGVHFTKDGIYETTSLLDVKTSKQLCSKFRKDFQYPFNDGELKINHDCFVKWLNTHCACCSGVNYVLENHFTFEECWKKINRPSNLVWWIGKMKYNSCHSLEFREEIKPILQPYANCIFEYDCINYVALSMLPNKQAVQLCNELRSIYTPMMKDYINKENFNYGK